MDPKKNLCASLRNLYTDSSKLQDVGVKNSVIFSSSAVLWRVKPRSAFFVVFSMVV